MTKDNSSFYGPGKITGTFKLAVSEAIPPSSQKKRTLEVLDYSYSAGDERSKEQHESRYQEDALRHALSIA